jgi:DNA-binding transcriptional ArsR family regulator
MNIEDMLENASKAANLLKNLANDKRLVILCELLGGERSVGELEKTVGLSQSALSQHLAKLRHSNFVKTRRESQVIFYSVADPNVLRILSVLHDIYCAPDKP